VPHLLTATALVWFAANRKRTSGVSWRLANDTERGGNGSCTAAKQTPHPKAIWLRGSGDASISLATCAQCVCAQEPMMMLWRFGSN